MGFKTNVLKNYLGDEQIYYIIGHDIWRYFKLIVKYCFYLLFLFAGYFGVSIVLLENTIISIIFATVGIIVYANFIIQFFDIYLDSIVLIDLGIVLFRWDGFLKNQSELINRESLEAAYDEQNGLMDIMFNKGNINIKRNDEDYVFKDIHNPGHQKSIIYKYKDQIMKAKAEGDKPQLDKFDVLVETLGEVILDYVQKEKKDYSDYEAGTEG